MGALNEMIDSFLEGVDLTDSGKAVRGTGVTFWLPLEYKEKYDVIQQRSNRKFGKALAKMIKTSIDRIEIETE